MLPVPSGADVHCPEPLYAQCAVLVTGATALASAHGPFGFWRVAVHVIVGQRGPAAGGHTRIRNQRCRIIMPTRIPRQSQYRRSTSGSLGMAPGCGILGCRDGSGCRNGYQKLTDLITKYVPFVWVGFGRAHLRCSWAFLCTALQAELAFFINRMRISRSWVEKGARKHRKNMSFF